MKLHLAPRLFGVFHGSAGHPAGGLQPLRVPSSAACPERLPGMLAPLPAPSPRPPQLRVHVLQSSPGLTPGFPVLCDYEAGARAEWSGRNGPSMDSVLLTEAKELLQKSVFSPPRRNTLCSSPCRAGRREPGAGQLPCSCPSCQALRDSLCSPIPVPDIPLHYPGHPPAFIHSCPGSASLPAQGCPSPTQQQDNITTKSNFVALYSLVHPDQLLGNLTKLNSLNCIPKYEIKWVDLLGCRSEGHPTALAFLWHQAESEPLTRQVLLLPALFICFSHVNIFKCSPQNNCKCHKTHFNGGQRSRQDLGPTGIIRAMQTKTG